MRGDRSSQATPSCRPGRRRTHARAGGALLRRGWGSLGRSGRGVIGRARCRVGRGHLARLQLVEMGEQLPYVAWKLLARNVPGRPAQRQADPGEEINVIDADGVLAWALARAHGYSGHRPSVGPPPAKTNWGQTPRPRGI